MLRDFTTLGLFLRNKRLSKGISQVYVAKHLGYSPQFVCNWERGTCAPPLEALPKISVLCDIKFDELSDIIVEETKRALASEFGRSFKRSRRFHSGK